MAVWITSSRVGVDVLQTEEAEKHSGDTILHSWEILSIILQSEEAKGIVCDIGM